MTPSRKLAQVHKWLGLSVAILVALQCASGMLLVYRADITATFHRSPAPPGVATAETVDRLISAVRDRIYPAQLKRIDFPERPGHPYIVNVVDPQDPAGSRFLGVRSGPEGIELIEGGAVRLLDVVFQLHHNLFNGDRGRYVSGVVGVVLIAMGITGLIIWWPGLGKIRRSLHISSGRPPVVFHWQLHRTVGVAGLPIAIVTLVSGTLLAFAPELRTSFDALPKLPESYASTTNNCEPGTLKHRFAAARSAFPLQSVRDLRFDNEGKLQRVMFENRIPAGIGAPHQAWLARCAPQVVLADNGANPDSTAKAIMGWLYPVHTGIAFGRGGQGIALFGGLALATMLVSSLLLWSSKRKLRRKARVRRSAGFSRRSMEH